MNDRTAAMRIVYILLLVILIIYGLIMARDFLYPLAFGVRLSYLLYPIVNFLEKKGSPRIFAILSAIIILVFVVSVFAVFFFKRIYLFMDELPYFREKAVRHLDMLQQFIESNFGIPAERLKNYLLTQIFDLSIKSEKLFSATTATIFAILMQPVYVFLILYYRTKFAYFFLKAVGRKNRKVTIIVLREIASVVTRYMLGVATVVLILCFFNTAGYWIIGLKYSLLLGVISALFSFIPYFGNFIGGSIPLIFALLTEDSIGYALRVVLFVFIVHFIENNILSPNIVGHNVRINPFVIIISLILGSMLWGLPGLLVIIPFVAMFYVIMKKIPSLQPYVYLIGTRGTRRHALTVENLKIFYDRIRNRKIISKT